MALAHIRKASGLFALPLSRSRQRHAMCARLRGLSLTLHLIVEWSACQRTVSVKPVCLRNINANWCAADTEHVQEVAAH